MKTLIVCRPNDPRIQEYAEKLGKYLSELLHTVIFLSEDQNPGSSALFSISNPPDLIIVIGGDGTILLTVQRMPIQVPMVGINWGEVGFLADLEPDEAFEFFRNFANTNQIEPRMRIAINVNGQTVGHALNEALIVTDRPAKMLKFLIFIGEVMAERFRADGLLISTPTGSTAYAMSAGGPIVDPRMEGFLLVPLAPFMLSNRPHLIDSSSPVRIILEASKPAKIVIDGQIELKIIEQTTVNIYPSPEPALFIKTGIHFFEKINRKLKHL